MRRKLLVFSCLYAFCAKEKKPKTPQNKNTPQGEGWWCRMFTTSTQEKTIYPPDLKSIPFQMTETWDKPGISSVHVSLHPFKLSDASFCLSTVSTCTEMKLGGEQSTESASVCLGTFRQTYSSYHIDCEILCFTVSVSQVASWVTQWPDSEFIHCLMNAGYIFNF